MNISEKDLLLYLVTDRHWLKEGETLEQVVETALQNGVTCVQLREKNADYEEFLSLAQKLRPLCKKYRIPFIVNDNVDIALAVDADGVHVGQDDMAVTAARKALGSGKIIGTSAHNLTEARKAVADGADYIGCGAVFGSSTKTDAGLLAVEKLKEICTAVDIPAVAIGGITRENIAALAGSGVDGVAVVSAIMAQEDKKRATAEMLELAKQITE